MRSISLQDIAAYAQAVDQPVATVAQRAVTTNGIYLAAHNNAVGAVNPRVFSLELTTGGVTNQKHSGRCWLFAALNTVRHRLETTLNVENIELSQSYPYFFDKLEKANVFLELVIDTADQPLDDRRVDLAMRTPQPEGGWWSYAAALIEKYGVVPKSAMAEAKTTEESKELNIVLDRRLRKGALQLRAAAEVDRADLKQAILRDIYRILVIAIGTPPTRFDWAYRDKDKTYHRLADLTPRQFAETYALPLDQVTVANDPAQPYGRVLVREDGENMVGTAPVTVVNQPMETLKDLVIKQLEAGEAVWLGCDVRIDVDPEGVMDTGVRDLGGLFGVDLAMSKAENLATFDSVMSHAMTITGVDVVDGLPRQWKVENSWGDDRGLKGWWTMSDAWFDRYGYTVVIRRDLLDEDTLAALGTEPIRLPRWAPLSQVAA